MQAAAIRMTPHQIALVRESFATVVPISEQAVGLFYDRLFAIDPSTRPLFQGDMKSQGVKLMAAIGAVVKSLDCIETILGDLRALARRHDRYGVREEHYASVGAALLWTLEELGLDFTPDAGSLDDRLWPSQRRHDRGLVGALTRRGLVRLMRPRACKRREPAREGDGKSVLSAGRRWAPRIPGVLKAGADGRAEGAVRRD